MSSPSSAGLVVSSSDDCMVFRVEGDEFFDATTLEVHFRHFDDRFSIWIFVRGPGSGVRDPGSTPTYDVLNTIIYCHGTTVWLRRY